MTRVAVVAESEEVRAAIAAALRASSAFDVVDVSASTKDVSAAAEIVITARERRQSTQAVAPAARDIATAPVLTQREHQILELLADGLGNKQIAARLGITTNTVKTHLELLFDKLDVSSRAEAVATAARTGLLLL
jgi:DNA-binding NarL/FixJ family response regulator